MLSVSQSWAAAYCWWPNIRPAARHHNACVEIIDPGSIAMTWRTSNTNCQDFLGSPEFLSGSVHFQYAFLYPFGSGSDQCLHPLPPLWIVRSPPFFVSRSGYLVKPQVDVQGSWWPANLCVLNRVHAESPIPAACSCWYLHTQLSPCILHSHQS